MSQHKINIQDIIFLMMYIFIKVYLFIKILMTSCFAFATLNLGRKKSTGTEPYFIFCHMSFMKLDIFKNDHVSLNKFMNNKNINGRVWFAILLRIHKFTYSKLFCTLVEIIFTVVKIKL